MFNKVSLQKGAVCPGHDGGAVAAAVARRCRNRSTEATPRLQQQGHRSGGGSGVAAAVARGQ